MGRSYKSVKISTLACGELITLTHIWRIEVAAVTFLINNKKKVFFQFLKVRCLSSLHPSLPNPLSLPTLDQLSLLSLSNLSKRNSFVSQVSGEELIMMN